MMQTLLKRFPLGEELVPVREAQKNITKYFKKGVARVTKNGKSLGYLISDEMWEELLEDIAIAHPAFIAEMETEEKDKHLTPLQDVMKEYGLTKKR